MRRNLARWIPATKADSRDRTSRAVFSGFCDSVASAADWQTGGAPQLVGLRRMGHAITFGVVWGERHYMSGSPDVGLDGTVESFDRHLQRVDRSGVPLHGAQRHAGRPI